MFKENWRLAALLTAAVLLLLAYAVPRLTGSSAVRGNSAAERCDAINRLASQRPTGAAEAIAKLALTDAEPSVRRTAIAALASFRRPEDRPIIDQALGDRDPSVRAVAVASLGSYGPDTVTRLSGLANDPDPQVRAGVVAGLTETGRGPGMAELLRMMARQGDPELQVKALRAIESISNVHYRNVPEPGDAAAWAHMVDRVRNNAWVYEALAAEKANGGKP
jgi:HEAT repeat protein